MALYILMLNLNIRKDGLAARTAIDQIVITINKAFVVK